MFARGKNLSVSHPYVPENTLVSHLSKGSDMPRWKGYEGKAKGADVELPTNPWSMVTMSSVT